MKLTKEGVLNLIGILLIFFSILRLYSIVRYDSFVYIFWLCNHVPLLIGITILARNSFWLTAEISLLFVGSLNWSLDFLSKLFFGKYLLGSTYYIFTAISIGSGISILLHLSTLPLALIAFFLINEKKLEAWKGAIIHSIILVPFVFYFGEKYNLNCMLRPCISWMPNFSFYPIVFFTGYILLLVIPINWILIKLVKNKNSK